MAALELRARRKELLEKLAAADAAVSAAGEEVDELEESAREAEQAVEARRVTKATLAAAAHKAEQLGSKEATREAAREAAAEATEGFTNTRELYLWEPKQISSTQVCGGGQGEGAARHTHGGGLPVTRTVQANAFARHVPAHALIRRACNYLAAAQTASLDLREHAREHTLFTRTPLHPPHQVVLDFPFGALEDVQTRAHARAEREAASAGEEGAAAAAAAAAADPTSKLSVTFGLSALEGTAAEASGPGLLESALWQLNSTQGAGVSVRRTGDGEGEGGSRKQARSERMTQRATSVQLTHALVPEWIGSELDALTAAAQRVGGGGAVAKVPSVVNRVEVRGRGQGCCLARELVSRHSTLPPPRRPA